MDSLREDVQSYAQGAEARLRQVTNVLLSNQQGLAESHTKLDDQFAVLTRLVISKLNEITSAYNVYMLDPNEAPQKIPLVTYDGVNEMFHEFDSFKTRPDFRDHMRTWFTGGDLTALPPVPEVKNEEQAPTETSAPQEEDFPEGAQIFGGNDESPNGDGEPEAGSERPAGEAAEMSSVQDAHDPSDQPNNPEALPEVPSV